MAKKIPLLFWILPVLFLGTFFFYPLGEILQLSYSRLEGDFLPEFIRTIKDPLVGNTLRFTFWQAFLSTLITLAVGLPGAYLFGRFHFKGKKLLRALTGVPFVMPTLVVAAGYYALLGPNGLANQLLLKTFKLDAPPIQFVNTFSAILTAHVFYNTTIVLKLVGDYWSRLDTHLQKAARVLGANRWKTFRDITLPLLLPSIAAATLLVFIFDFTSFGVVLILGGPRFATMEVEIYYQTISLFNLPLAATLSILQVGFTLMLTLGYTRLSNLIKQPIQLQGIRQTERKLGTALEKWSAGIFLSVLLFFLTSPLLALLIRSFSGLTKESFMTLEYYLALAQNPQEGLFYVPPTTAMGVSLVYGLMTIVLALVLGVPAALALAKEKLTVWDKILDPLLMLPLGTSAVTLGLGFLVALDHPPLDLRTSPLLVPIAHTLVAFPFVVRSLTPALSSIQPSLRKAAAVLGASPQKIIREIDLPLIGRALLVAASFAFMISLGEFGASSLITRPEFPTIPVVIYRLLSRPGAINYGQAMALSSILMMVTLAGMLVMEYFRIGDMGEF